MLRGIRNVAAGEGRDLRMSASSWCWKWRTRGRISGAERAGMGLISMRERAELVKGTVEFLEAQRRRGAGANDRTGCERRRCMPSRSP